MTDQPTQPKADDTLISLPQDFQFGQVLPEGAALLGAQPEPPLGVALSRFTGTFSGPGFNTIFRPRSSVPDSGTAFPNPIPPGIPDDNVLELNLTQETLSFTKALGSVPNRGLRAQADIFLNGVPYAQAVNDVTNTDTGRGDGAPVGIHFEPGLWMRVPATETQPVLGASLARMASIPHGTTINAQGLEPAAATSGPPDISPVGITPFVIGNPGERIHFASQTASDAQTPRIPQDLTRFIEAGTITQAVLDDPTQVLRAVLASQTVLDTVTFTVTTAPQPPEFGGGIDNIAFLEGDASRAQPNANSVLMASTFWIETVQHQIVVPPYQPGQPALKLSPAPTLPGLPVPVFEVTPPRELTESVTLTVTSTQIQYAQTVLLDFAGLSWPHVSVATLVPEDLQTVPASAWA
ncbi:hypothetical protein GIY62_17870 [Burkholderia plantarii]|uniref:heme-binding protein n=1 Tax=Burkholderia plantarii TaxID=41899 RepID=UPI00272A0337|nr:heme-binding protein [Burkholderia plantarii]WLE58947.1 hypothetical protein GIY62_17870 [Burkholderia plantarii]